MCGIVGVVGQITPKYETWFKEALVVDTVRGADSTGVFCVTTNNEVKIAKAAVDGPLFVDGNKDFRDIINIGNKTALIGHNRAATRGKISCDNAHPFQIGDVTMVHNGTMTYVKNMSSYSVDSQALTALVNTDGAAAFEDSFGAYSVIGYNTATKRLFVARNAERPMSWAATDDGRVLFASELPMLLWLAIRNNITINKHGTTSEDTMYLMDLLNLQKSPEEIKIKKPVRSYTGVGTSYYTGHSSTTQLTRHKKLPNINKATPLLPSQLGDLGINRHMYIKWCKFSTVGNNVTGRLTGHTVESPFYETFIEYVTYDEISRYIGKVSLLELNEVGDYTSDDPYFVSYKSHLFKGEPKSPLNNVIPLKKEEQDVPFVQTGSRYKGPNGENLSHKKWKKLVKDGCSCCGGTIHRKDATKMGYITQTNDPVCPSCMEQWGPTEELKYAH